MSSSGSQGDNDRSADTTQTQLLWRTFNIECGHPCFSNLILSKRCQLLNMVSMDGDEDKNSNWF